MAKKEKIDCLEKNCANCNKQCFLSIVPFDIEDKFLKEYFTYFLYKAPNIESEHSFCITETMQNDIISKMWEKSSFKYMKFTSQNSVNEKAFKEGFLFDEEFCFKCKRFVCKKKVGKNQHETDFNCFLRHIRNAIAHGRIKILKKGDKTYLLFIDQTDKKVVNTKILCTKTDLKNWMSIIKRETKSIKQKIK